MSCDKCTDIHYAQREGKTSDECRCTCHKEKINPLTNPIQPNYIPYYPNHDPCCPTIPYSPIWCGTPYTTCHDITSGRTFC